MPDKPLRQYLHGSGWSFAVGETIDSERRQGGAPSTSQEILRSRVTLLGRPGTLYTDEQADALLDSPQAHHPHQMMTYSAVGTADIVHKKVTEFAEQTGADELSIAHQGPRVEERLRSAELLAEAYLT